MNPDDFKTSVTASYVFYGWWDWRFLFLILLSTLTDYGIGLGLSKQEHPTKRKILLGTSILVNLLFLGFFKYYNFFVDTFMTAFSFLGMKLNPQHLHIILPVGISFYTFQTMSYSIDVYKKKLEPTRDFIAFAAFVSFFPQLVAGPIERAANLLPQFYTKRVFDYDKAVDGCKQMLWGFFKKMVIADNCAIYANMIFNNYQEYSGSTLVLGALFFTFQIYGDFSGYSDIAIGSSRLFGINLMRNFATPYFSRDMAEFWRRWHISLSTWFRDYVYIPLGGSRGGTLIVVRNTFIIFMVSGLWHGANWTFVFWGFLNGVYFLPLLLLKKNRVHIDSAAQGKLLPSGKEALSIMITFGLTVFGWIFFRAENIGHALRYIAGIFSPSSLFYCTQYEFDNYYEYVKERYIRQYLVILQPKVRDLVRSYLYAKVRNIIPPKQHQPKAWAEMAFEDRIKNTEARVLSQFPSQKNSATLEATLLKIIHTCEEHDIKLIGIKFPLSSEYLTVLADKTYNVAHILKSNGIAILDYNSVFRYNNEYFQDTDHVNKQGGLELVKLLGADINQ